jgi:hypothetical protein
MALRQLQPSQLAQAYLASSYLSPRFHLQKTWDDGDIEPAADLRWQRAANRGYIEGDTRGVTYWKLSPRQ